MILEPWSNVIRQEKETGGLNIEKENRIVTVCKGWNYRARKLKRANGKK